MHDPDATPRLRRRVLKWGIAAVILLPVLYVAAAGPLWWSLSHRDPEPEWYAYYQDSLEPLNQFSPFEATMEAYCLLWEEVPAPRSWKRAKIVQEIEWLKKEIEDVSVAEQQWREQTARVQSAMKRLRALLNQPKTEPGREEEIAQLREAIEKEQQLANAFHPVSAGQRRAVFQVELEAAEQRLRQFDAQ